MNEILESDIRDNIDKDKRKILTCYGLFFISIFLALIPFGSVAIFAIMFCICVLAGIYSMRAKAYEGGFVHTHMTFLIRTFWRVNLYAIVTILFAGLYLFIFADYKSINVCIDVMSRAINMGDISRIEALITSCETLFFKENQKQLVISAVIALGPIAAYLLHRLLKGGSLALNNMAVTGKRL